MESTEPDTAAQRSSEKATHISFLVPQALAGSVIGRGGSRITQFQDRSGAQIVLSSNREYYPGTTCRIVVVSGTTTQVVSAVALVLGKLRDELKPEDGSDVELGRTRIVVPHTTCGGIIGRGGATIRSFIEESKAGIKISPMDNTDLGLSDRLLTLTGTMEEQMRAIALILTKLTEDDDYSQKVHYPKSYARVGFHGWNFKSHSALGSGQTHKEDNFNLVTISVSDEHTGVLLGCGGSRIKQTSQLSGARIKISGRGDFVPGTTDRKVTISGSQRSIDLALWIIQVQVYSASKRPKRFKSK